LPISNCQFSSLHALVIKLAIGNWKSAM